MSELALWDMPGGIHPAENKSQSNGTPIQQAPLPKRLILPLNQHIGAAAEPCVAVGERVLKGQLIANANGMVSVPMHAPTSGIVSFIGPQPYPHVSGLLSDAIVIDSDGLEQWIELSPCADYRTLSPAELLAIIRGAGINGLGGAGFPTAIKLSARATQKIHTLIINGTECEPYISADDRLMRERAAQLISGIEILAQLIEPQTLLIGIEDNKPEAIAAVQAAIGERPFSLKVLPSKYPSGGEKQLIQILTGIEVPSGGLPADIGMLCLNVGTAVAIQAAVVEGRPLISRITTLTGAALSQPMNVEALIGTPVGELLAFAGLQEAQLDRLLLGGPMMGFSLPSLDVPLIKTSNCLLASTASELPPPPPALPCIRCGDCADVCPASLLPQQLHFFALGQQHEQLKTHNLFDCIECGACAYVCPSNIPLVQYYRAAKGEIRELENKQLKADQSRQRFEQRQERLRCEQEQKDAERKARTEKAARAQAALAASQTATESGSQTAAPVGLGDEQKKLKIAASMAQVTLKKAEKQLAMYTEKGGDTGELKTQVEQLRNAALLAQNALDAALATASPAPSAAVADSEQALKKAKIEAAMLRAQLRKLEQLQAPSAEQGSQLQGLRSQLAAAEQALESMQNLPPASSEPAPTSPAMQALKQAKIALAMRRAELKKAEQNAADSEQLLALRQALTTAEQALHAAEANSGKPVPDLQRVDKQPIDEATRALKTELAFARADLRKLEREPSTPDAALHDARQRLLVAEQQLQLQQNT